MKLIKKAKKLILIQNQNIDLNVPFKPVKIIFCNQKKKMFKNQEKH